MARCCSKEAGRIILWMCWVIQWLVTSIYVALALITFAKLWQAASEVSFSQPTIISTDSTAAAQQALNVQQHLADIVKNKIWRAPLASLILSAALIVGFTLLSCVILLRKSINRGGPGFGYGFMVAFTFSLSLFLLLCGLVLDGFKKVVSEHLEQAPSWSKYSTEGYLGAEVFALLSFCTYFIFGIILVVLQAAVSDQLGMDNAKGFDNPYSTAAVPMVGTPGSAPPDYSTFEQFGNYEQYGDDNQGAQGQQQGYFNGNTFQAQGSPSYYANGNKGNGGTYQAADYQTVEYDAADDYQYQPTTAQPTGFGYGHAVYQTPVATADATPATGLMSGQANYGNQGNQQI